MKRARQSIHSLTESLIFANAFGYNWNANTRFAHAGANATQHNTTDPIDKSHISHFVLLPFVAHTVTKSCSCFIWPYKYQFTMYKIRTANWLPRNLIPFSNRTVLFLEILLNIGWKLLLGNFLAISISLSSLSIRHKLLKNYRNIWNANIVGWLSQQILFFAFFIVSIQWFAMSRWIRTNKAKLE